jgi:hypothetical protein
MAVHSLGIVKQAEDKINPSSVLKQNCWH